MTRGDKPLRSGFTTGTAASAAAKAATLALLGAGAPESVVVTLPSSWNGADAPPQLVIPISECSVMDGHARAGVIKDAGDDPDATDGALIVAEVMTVKETPDPADPGPQVVIEGGVGVGRVTLPGLPVPPGRAAINPEPMRQIELAVREAVDMAGNRDIGGLNVVISVPDGKRLAKKTMNPALGILGGISILGTRGTVKPFSHEAYLATVRQALDVAKATGVHQVVLATGGRSERFARGLWPELPPTAFLQAGDLFAAGCEEAGKRGFEKAHWAVFFGKLVKMAQGLASTHAREGQLDLPALVDRACAAGLAGEHVAKARESATARGVLRAVSDCDGSGAIARRLVEDLARDAVAHACRFAGGTMPVGLAVFDENGRIVCLVESDATS